MGTHHEAAGEQQATPAGAVTRRAWLRQAAAGLGALPFAGCGGGGGTSGGGGSGSGDGGGASGGGGDGRQAYTLRARLETVEIGGVTATLRSFGSIPGPLIRTRPGGRLRITLINDMPDVIEPEMMAGATMTHNMPHDYNAINLHTHGFQSSPKDPGDNVLLTIRPGQQHEYVHDLPPDHPPGFHWYHPHKHGSAAIQFLSGMAGIILVEGGLDDVPEIAAAKDELMIIQEIRLGADGQVAQFYDALAGINDHTFHLVNGQLEPTYTMSPGEIQRWRILNANARDYLHLTLDGHTFHVLSNDGLSLPAPEQVGELLLAPGQRVEVLVVGGGEGSYRLLANAYSSGFVGIRTTKALATLQITGAAMAMALPGSLPLSERQTPIGDGQIAATQTMEFGLAGHYVINGQVFDPNRIDFRVRVGTSEEWLLLNSTAEDHPFHIHTNPFVVTKINGASVAPVWRDTVTVPRSGGSVTIRHRFQDYNGIYPCHCHILAHEDTGMMALVEAS